MEQTLSRESADTNVALMMSTGWGYIHMATMIREYHETALAELTWNGINIVRPLVQGSILSGSLTTRSEGRGYAYYARPLIPTMARNVSRKDSSVKEWKAMRGYVEAAARGYAREMQRPDRTKLDTCTDLPKLRAYHASLCGLPGAVLPEEKEFCGTCAVELLSRAEYLQLKQGPADRIPNRRRTSNYRHPQFVHVKEIYFECARLEERRRAAMANDTAGPFVRALTAAYDTGNWETSIRALGEYKSTNKAKMYFDKKKMFAGFR